MFRQILRFYSLKTSYFKILFPVTFLHELDLDVPIERTKSFLEHLFSCLAYLLISNSHLCTYDLYGPVRNVFDACRSITRGCGRGLGPRKPRVFRAL
jgi:hypothetical protein